MMRPTTRLRFVEREAREYYETGVARVFKNRILQQWWEDEFHYDESTKDRAGEWRDVPLEVE